MGGGIYTVQESRKNKGKIGGLGLREGLDMVIMGMWGFRYGIWRQWVQMGLRNGEQGCYRGVI